MSERILVLNLGREICNFLYLYRFLTFLQITSYESYNIKATTSEFGLKQIIKEPTHLIQICSSCTALIFTSQPNIVMESGFQSSLHQNYYHQINFEKVNLKIHYSMTNESEIWHYEKANTDHIQRSINDFHWDGQFATANVN